MTPRPRETTDADLLMATAKVMGRIGPRMTLADVAKEAGVVAATLVQRFGSKRGLLLALSRSGLDALKGQFQSARAQHASPLKALIELYVGCTQMVSSPEELSNHLAFLQIDLADPEFHKLALEHSRKLRAETRRLLDHAVDSGDLAPDCDTARLARAIQIAYNGVMITWAVEREGNIGEWMRRELETLLNPYRIARPPRLYPAHARERKRGRSRRAGAHAPG